MNATGWTGPLVTAFASLVTTATVAATEHDVSVTVAEGG
jgi:hypothetical protein